MAKIATVMTNTEKMDGELLFLSCNFIGPDFIFVFKAEVINSNPIGTFFMKSMALTSTRSKLRRKAEQDLKGKWIIVLMKIDRIFRIIIISDNNFFSTRQ